VSKIKDSVKRVIQNLKEGTTEQKPRKKSRRRETTVIDVDEEPKVPVFQEAILTPNHEQYTKEENLYPLGSGKENLAPNLESGRPSLPSSPPRPLEAVQSYTP